MNEVGMNAFKVAAVTTTGFSFCRLGFHLVLRKKTSTKKPGGYFGGGSSTIDFKRNDEIMAIFFTLPPFGKKACTQQHMCIIDCKIVCEQRKYLIGGYQLDNKNRACKICGNTPRPTCITMHNKLITKN